MKTVEQLQKEAEKYSRNFRRYAKRMRAIYPNWRSGKGLPGYPPYRRNK